MLSTLFHLLLVYNLSDILLYQLTKGRRFLRVLQVDSMLSKKVLSRSSCTNRGIRRTGGEATVP